MNPELMCMMMIIKIKANAFRKYIVFDNDRAII